MTRWLRRERRAASADPDPDRGPDQPFLARPVVYETFTAELRAMVDRLAPGAVDEETPHVLDKFIDWHALMWIARLVKDRARYEDELMPHLVRASAELAYLEVLHEADLRNLNEMRVARGAAVMRLLGIDEFPRQPQQPEVAPASPQHELPSTPQHHETPPTTPQERGQ